MAWLGSNGRGIEARESNLERAEGETAVGRPWPAIAVVAIFLVAVGLRVWRLDWGLAYPRHLGFPDEPIMWGHYVRDFIPLRWTSFDQTDLNYPTLYGYLIGLAASALHAIGWLAAPPVAGAMGAVPASSVILARAVSVLASLATVGLVTVAAWRWYSPRIGLLAGALMAVTPFDVVYVHVASPDTLLATTAIGTTLLAYRLAISGSPLVAALAGALAGAATTTKYTGLAFIATAGWAALENAVARRSARRAAALLLAAAAGFAIAVALTCPPCVLHGERLSRALGNHLLVNRTLYPNLHNNFIAPTLGWYGRPYVYQLVASLPYALGWPLYLAALGGIVMALRNRTLPDRLLLATIGPYFVAMGGAMVVYPRYVLPLLPALAILAARAVSSIAPRRLAVAAAAGVSVYSFALGGSHVARFSLDQQRSVAQWIASAQHARPSGARARVGYPKMLLDYFRLAAPLSAAGLARMELSDGAWFRDPPEYLVLPDWYAIAIERDMPQSPVAADLARLRSGEAGYERVAEWRSSYLQQDLYTRLDPAFAADLWQGEIGFTVYARRRDDAG